MALGLHLAPSGIANVLAAAPDLNFTQLGVAGTVDVLLLAALGVVWTKYQKALAEKDAITAAVLPALTQSSVAQQASALAIDRVTRLYEQRAVPPGDGR